MKTGRGQLYIFIYSPKDQTEVDFRRLLHGNSKPRAGERCRCLWVGNCFLFNFQHETASDNIKYKIKSFVEISWRPMTGKRETSLLRDDRLHLSMEKTWPSEGAGRGLLFFFFLLLLFFVVSHGQILLAKKREERKKPMRKIEKTVTKDKERLDHQPTLIFLSFFGALLTLMVSG